MIKNRENNSRRQADASLVRQRELFKERSETWYAELNKWLAEQEKEIKEMKAILSPLLKRGFFVLPADDTELESLPEKSLITPVSE